MTGPQDSPVWAAMSHPAVVAELRLASLIAIVKRESGFPDSVKRRAVERVAEIIGMESAPW